MIFKFKTLHLNWIDYVLSMVIVDPTYFDGLPINVFAESEDKLPSLRVGDIFRCHRMMINFYNGKRQGMGSKRFGFSFVVIDRFDATITSSSTTCTFTPDDLERIKALKLWWEATESRFMKKQELLSNDSNQAQPSSNPQGEQDNDQPQQNRNKRMKLEQLSASNDHCEVICQIVQVSNLEGSGSTQRITLKVWDGTGNKTPALNARNIAQNEKIMHDPSSSFGPLMTVVVWNGGSLPLYREGKIAPGQWVRLRGAQTKIYGGGMELKMSTGSFIELLNEDDERVKELVKEYLVRMDIINSKPLEPLTLFGTITMTSGDDLPPYLSLKEIYDSENAVGKFRCKAKLNRFSPTIKNFSRPHCTPCDKGIQRFFDDETQIECPRCNTITNDAIWIFQLLLQDDSGTLEVIVYQKEGDTFLGNTASNLYINQFTLNSINKKIQSLLNPNIWMDCCIKSYLTPNGLRKFQLFDTKIK
eukprot:TRINITY_DN1212_c0_g1_i1.p1 TRINITY_DN1212_c0_g1~~TRINITY_DN1212_c0_g1_i1.p1  ORF type:complete len:473 (+),score=93.18 TRINITY_DN1212_c0_g1_i1:348-1766(+)